jgi:hypothetical protein
MKGESQEARPDPIPRERDVYNWWWSLRPLVDALIDQRLTSKAQSGYLFGWIVAVAPSLFLLSVPGQNGLVAVLRMLAGLLIIAAGTSVCFQANERGDGHDFLPRIICLGWPIALRVGLGAFLPGKIILMIIESHSGCSFTMYFNPIIQGIYFWRLHHWIGVVSRGKSNSDIISARSELDDRAHSMNVIGNQRR